MLYPFPCWIHTERTINERNTRPNGEKKGTEHISRGNGKSEEEKDREESNGEQEPENGEK